MADDDRVQVLSSVLVHANNKTSSPKRIPLTPCDLRLLLVGTIQKGLLFRKPSPPAAAQTTAAFIENLKSSFSRALSLFYPFSGRLSADEHEDSTVSVYIDCNDAGAQFVHAAADGISVADIVDPLYVPPVLWSFFPLNWLRNYHGFEYPLVGVQVTELADGIFVGWTISHAVADGATIWRFINFWSDIYRSGCPPWSPAFSRDWFLDEKHHPIKIPRTMIEDIERENDNLVLPPLKERVFHFSRQKLDDLKAQANAATNGDNKISSLQSLISHLWRAMIRNGKNYPDLEAEVAFVVQVGFRSRLKPRFPDDYFGNAVMTWPIALKVKVLLEEGLGHVAAEINKVVTSLSHEKLKGAVESWIGNPKMPTLRGLVVGGMALSGSPRFDVYGNDFGWGPPVAVRSGAGNKFDGKVTVYPGAEGGGSMDVEICLSPETAERLGSDPEFMAAVGN